MARCLSVSLLSLSLGTALSVAQPAPAQAVRHTNLVTCDQSILAGLGFLPAALRNADLQSRQSNHPARTLAGAAHAALTCPAGHSNSISADFWQIRKVVLMQRFSMRRISY
jgi:hypothetical protein